MKDDLKDDLADRSRALIEKAERTSAEAERLLEVNVVARRLKKCPETVRRYIRDGRLKATRAPLGNDSRGGNYLVPESAVDAFLATSHNIMRRDAR